MAPPEDEKSESMGSQIDERPISTIVIIIAMQTEALPLVNKFQLSQDIDSVFPKGVPWVRYHGIYNDLNINIIWPGKDHVSGVDCVGTVSASLVTYASIQALQPDLIINAGTAGGFRAKGACIGDVFLASDIAFHDRRIPIPVFDLYGVGLRKACLTPKLSKELNLKVYKNYYELLNNSSKMITSGFSFEGNANDDLELGATYLPGPGSLAEYANGAQECFWIERGSGSTRVGIPIIRVKTRRQPVALGIARLLGCYQCIMEMFF